MLTLLFGADALADLEIKGTLDQTSYFVGEPIQWSITATNNSDQAFELWFPTTSRYTFDFDREPTGRCSGGDAETLLNLAPHESTTWVGTKFLSDVGPHTFNSRICLYDFVAEPITFDIVEPPPTTDDVFIDFEYYPDGTSTENLGYLRDAYAAWGVHFVNAGIGRQPWWDSAYAKGGLYTDEGFAVWANLKMPVYGVSARVLSARDRSVTMVAFDQAGQELGSINSGPSDWPDGWRAVSLSTETPITSLFWKSSDDRASVFVDDLGLTVRTILPFPEPSPGGDVNLDGALDTFDLDLISAELLRSAPRSEFDFDSNGQVDNADRIFWMSQIGSIRPGDSNADGRFASSDLVQVFEANEYEDALVRNSAWAEGDWNGDLEFDTADLVFAFRDGRYEQEPLGGAKAVPEPSSFAILFGVLAGIALVSVNRRKVRLNFELC